LAAVDIHTIFLDHRLLKSHNTYTTA